MCFKKVTANRQIYDGLYIHLQKIKTVSFSYTAFSIRVEPKGGSNPHDVAIGEF